MKECKRCGTVNASSDKHCYICGGTRFTHHHHHDEHTHGEILEVGLRMSYVELGILGLFWAGLAAMFYYALGIQIPPHATADVAAIVGDILPNGDALTWANVLPIAGIAFVVTGSIFLALRAFSRRWPMSLTGLRRLRKLAYSTVLAVTAGLATALAIGWFVGRTWAGMPVLFTGAVALVLPALFALVFCHSLARVRCPNCGCLMEIKNRRISGDSNIIGLDQEFHGRRHHCDACNVAYTVGYFSGRWI
ncbi:hypothetical protein KQI84_11055 [bacterium]|nr:hypothetical protein [bacterium]